MNGDEAKHVSICDAARIHEANSNSTVQPIATWVLMVLSIVSALMLLDWSGAGGPKPFGFLFSPTLLGFAGMGFAVYNKRMGWAILSAALGLMMIPLLIFVVTLISGP